VDVQDIQIVPVEGTAMDADPPEAARVPGAVHAAIVPRGLQLLPDAIPVELHVTVVLFPS